jgi:four helix bundle protein
MLLVSGMAGVRDHSELDVWKLADEVRKQVWTLVARPAFRSEWSLRNQLKEAAESPCPNIAEGFSRFHTLEFSRFLRIAKGSLSEVIDHAGAAQAKGLITDVEKNVLCSYARRARGAATKLILYLESTEAPGLKRRQSRR